MFLKFGTSLDFGTSSTKGDIRGVISDSSTDERRRVVAICHKNADSSEFYTAKVDSGAELAYGLGFGVDAIDSELGALQVLQKFVRDVPFWQPFGQDNIIGASVEHAVFDG